MRGAGWHEEFTEEPEAADERRFVENPDCRTGLPRYNGPLMSIRCASMIIVVCLAGTIAPRHYSGDSEGGTSVSVPEPGAREDGPKAADADDSQDSEPTDSQYPEDHVVLKEGAMEHVPRVFRITSVRRLAGPGPARRVLDAQPVAAIGSRLARVVAEARCVTTSLCVVAFPVRSHAPPICV